MVCQASVDPWLPTRMPHLPQLSKPPATVWALGSCGRVLARACALPAVRPLRAKGRQRTEQTVRQPRRAWYDAPPRQRGPTRPALHVAPWFPVVRGWVVSCWQGTPLALALAATAWEIRGVGWAVRVV